MDEYPYTAGQTMEAADIPVSIYTQWKARGIIKSGYKSKIEKSGPGIPALYTFAEVFRVAVLARLVALGISVGTAATHVDHLYGFMDSKAYLLVRRWPDPEHDGADYGEATGTTATILRHEKLLAEETKYEGVIVINLDKIEARVKKALGLGKPQAALRREGQPAPAA